MKYFAFFVILSIYHVKESSSASLSLQNEKEKCLEDKKVYFEGKCYSLLTKGPCSKGQWLVLKKTKGVESDPVCEEEKCNDGEYYWSKTKSCVKAKDTEDLCGSSTEVQLATNAFGEGECRCKEDPPTARLKGFPSCHLLYSRGPCPAGKVLGFQNVKSTTAECIEDPCHKEKLRRGRAGEISAETVLAQYEDGKCYELDTQGPCEENWTFKVHTTLKRPACVSLLNKIYGSNCAKDQNGICVNGLGGKKGISIRYAKVQWRKTPERNSYKTKFKLLISSSDIFLSNN